MKCFPETSITSYSFAFATFYFFYIENTVMRVFKRNERSVILNISCRRS